MGLVGNKGGVGVRLTFHQTRICFVNSHLPAHQPEIERRNEDFHHISNRSVVAGCMLQRRTFHPPCQTRVPPRGEIKPTGTSYLQENPGQRCELRHKMWGVTLHTRITRWASGWETSTTGSMIWWSTRWRSWWGRRGSPSYWATTSSLWSAARGTSSWATAREQSSSDRRTNTIQERTTGTPVTASDLRFVRCLGTCNWSE